MNPFGELACFSELVLACLLFVLIHKKIHRLPGKFYFVKVLRLFHKKDILNSRNFFAQLMVFELVRISCGLLWLYRSIMILLNYLNGGAELSAVYASACAVLLSCFIAVGFFTPLSCVSLALTQNVFLDSYTQTNCLPSQVVSFILWSLALVPAGSFFSIDAWLMDMNLPISKVLQSLYKVCGKPRRLSLIMARLLALLAFSALHFSSGLMHLSTESWRQGFVNIWVLTDPIMSPLTASACQWLYNHYTYEFSCLARISTWLTLVAMLLFLPFFLSSKLTRRTAVMLELCFIGASCSALSVRLLGWVQLLLLVLILSDSIAYWVVSRKGLFKMPVRQLRLHDSLPIFTQVFFASFIVCIFLFVLRQPLLTARKFSHNVYKATVSIFHRSPLFFGLREVNAFNMPMEKQKFGVYAVLRPENSGTAFCWIPAVHSSFLVSDAVFYKSIIYYALVDKSSANPTVEQIYRLLLSPPLKSLLKSEMGKRLSMSFIQYTCPDAADIKYLNKVNFQTVQKGICHLSLSDLHPQIEGSQLVASYEGINLLRKVRTAAFASPKPGRIKSERFQMSYTPSNPEDFLTFDLFPEKHFGTDEVITVIITLPKLADDSFGNYLIQDEKFRTIRAFLPPFWERNLVCCLTADELGGSTLLTLVGGSNKKLPLPERIVITRCRLPRGLKAHG